jgi:hypothetical protein
MTKSRGKTTDDNKIMARIRPDRLLATISCDFFRCLPDTKEEEVKKVSSLELGRYVTSVTLFETEFGGRYLLVLQY